MELPNDPAILVSFVNTMLRDKYKSLAELCGDYNIDESVINDKLLQIGYTYNKIQNQFK